MIRQHHKETKVLAMVLVELVVLLEEVMEIKTRKAMNKRNRRS